MTAEDDEPVLGVQVAGWAAYAGEVRHEAWPGLVDVPRAVAEAGVGSMSEAPTFTWYGETYA